MFDPITYKITDYLNTTFTCSCGRTHSVPIKNIIIKEDALLSIPELLSSNNFHKPFILYDRITYQAEGKTLEELLRQSSIPFTGYMLCEEEPTPDERTLGEVLIHYDTSCDLILAAGSGTINDLCRYISYKLGLPYLITGTAPSMDGFASNVAPLIVNHMKTTYEAHTPFAIIGDTEVMKSAPMKMIAAGIGDILGKYTCLCDWKIAHMITEEYYCTQIEGIVRQSIKTVIQSAAQVNIRKPEAMQSIMDALVLSGIAMSFAGNSRPASGSEHHLSHYWEMMFLFEGKKPVLHGTKVGIGTISVIKAYELLISKPVDFEKAVQKAADYSEADWEANIKSAYLKAADSVIALEREVHKNAPENVIPRIKKLRKNWPELVSVIKQLPSADEIRQLLSSLDAPASPQAVGIDKTTFINSFLYAKDLRNRFGLLQILFDLGMTEEIAEQVWDYFK